MANAGTLANQQKPAVFHAEPKRSLARLAGYWDFLAVLLLMVVSLPLAWLAPQALVVIRHPGTFDDHWVLDTAFKASRGIWYLRDAVFLYGPLGHWLLAAPSRLAGLSMGSIYTSYGTLVLWCSFLFAYLTLRLLLPEQPAWKRFLLLLLLAVFWAPWDGRTAFGIFLFAVFLRGWYSVRERRLKPGLFGGASALLCAVAFLYSADTGIYGIAAFGLSLAGVAWEGRREWQTFRQYAVAAATCAISLVLLVFVINAAIATPLDFRFWKSALALVAVHRWNEPAGITEAGVPHLLGPLLAGGALFLIRWFVPADRTVTITARTGFLLSAFAFALLAMQSGLVRSDPMHIVFAAYPMLFFAGTVLFSFRSRIVSALAAIAAVASSVVLADPAPVFRPASLRYRLGQMRHPLKQCPDGFSEVDRACFPASFADLLHTTSNYLQQQATPRDSVLIFPYQYMFAVAARRNEAGAVEQSFLAVGPYLSQLDIGAMQKASAPAGLYFPDGDLSLPIDGVSNFTRTPDIWLWIFRHYRSDRQLAQNVVALQKDDARAATISMQAQPLLIPAKTYPIRERRAEVDLGEPLWPAEGADFLRLRLNVRYGPAWKLRKPERLQLEITRMDGSRELKPFVIEPNVSSEVWFYPWNDADLARYFDADEGRWRSTPRPAIARLRLLLSPLDWVSQTPDTITVESADAVKFNMGH